MPNLASDHLFVDLYFRHRDSPRMPYTDRAQALANRAGPITEWKTRPTMLRPAYCPCHGCD